MTAAGHREDDDMERRIATTDAERGRSARQPRVGRSHADVNAAVPGHVSHRNITGHLASERVLHASAQIAGVDADGATAIRDGSHAMYCLRGRCRNADGLGRAQLALPNLKWPSQTVWPVWGSR